MNDKKRWWYLDLKIENIKKKEKNKVHWWDPVVEI